MYFLYITIDNKKYYLVEAPQVLQESGFEIFIEEPDMNKPPNNSCYWVNIDDVHFEMSRLASVTPSELTWHVEKWKWLDLHKAEST